MTPRYQTSIVPLEQYSSGVSGRRRPRILYMITRAERGGAQSHVLDLINGFREEFEVVLATGEEGFLTEACRAESVRVHILPHLKRDLNPLHDARAYFEASRIIEREQPDLVHIHTWKAGFLGRLAAHRQGIPSLYTAHMWHFGPSVPLTWRIMGPKLERIASKWSESTIAVSDSGKAFAAQYRIADPSRIVPIHNGIPDLPGRCCPGANEIPVVVMVARFTPFKDHETMLRAFALVKRPARLRLIGDGPTRGDIERLIAELGIADRVELLGDRGDVAQQLCAADIFVLASHTEHLPISILEAMRAGLPVIASHVGGVPELVVHGKTGWLVPAESISELARTLNDLIDDQEKRASFGRASRLWYEKHFLLGRMLDRTRELYAKILGLGLRQAQAADPILEVSDRLSSLEY